MRFHFKWNEIFLIRCLVNHLVKMFTWNITKRNSLRVLFHCSQFDKNNFFFLSGLSFTDTDNSLVSRGREETFFYSTLSFPPAHEHSDIYVQLCTWHDYHIFLTATLVFTRLLLDEIYHLIELLFDWLMMWCWF